MQNPLVGVISPAFAGRFTSEGGRQNPLPLNVATGSNGCGLASLYCSTSVSALTGRKLSGSLANSNHPNGLCREDDGNSRPTSPARHRQERPMRPPSRPLRVNGQSRPCCFKQRASLPTPQSARAAGAHRRSFASTCAPAPPIHFAPPVRFAGAVRG